MRKIYLNEIAKHFNIPEHVIRFYHKKGLIPYMKMDLNNYRYILEKDIDWFNTIRCLKNTGMSLKEIEKYIKLAEIGDTTVLERQNMIIVQKEIVNQKIKELEKQKNWLDYKIDFYNKKNNFLEYFIKNKLFIIKKYRWRKEKWNDDFQIMTEQSICNIMIILIQGI
ncbi:MerR family transcriptional regulator [Spiroplasma taiwanense]|uniref:MerR family transcriptional regulator n=1 Tax=Spiroplasma taiwanense CT-1 TaxID=1276220 RepID=S5LYK9_9MOLU|nr:MerR family transcriptional regulator [Spiroplasma taiwanense]AGR40737.1 MerR family transcriptional regulator [Spiroplasma taiwanense CT-1]